MNQPIALIIDDEPDIRELLELTLNRMDVSTRSAENCKHAQHLLQNHPFDLCLTDMRLPDGNGLELVDYIQKNYPNLPVAVITAHGNMESAVQALKSGAFDFVSKPVELHDLRNLVSTALKLSRKHRHSRLTLLGDSQAMRETRSKIDKLARSQAPVYISGESGCGKELVARLIHDQGPRADNAFVPVNCGAIPHDLMESEFFGFKKGSFTGALQDKIGLFQAAHGGTLFLDEVADLPLHMQVKLLRAIQEKNVRPVGAQKEIHVDIRILSATHKNLQELVNAGEFRQDLFYRINVIELRVPPLRERVEDIHLLSYHIINRKCREQGYQIEPKLNQEALAVLKAYAFPGNVRELENILERAMTLCENNTIKPCDLQLPEQVALQQPGLTKPMPSSQDIALEPYLDNLEKGAILNALQQTGNNKTAAAKILGISFRALRYRLKKLGIQ